MKSQNLGFRAKLIVSFLLAGVLPMLVTSSISYFKSKTEIESQAQERARLAGLNKADIIQDYFETEMNGIVDLSASPLVSQTLLEFSNSYETEFKNIPNETLETYRKEVREFYSSQFAVNFTEKTKESINTDTYVSRLDGPSIVAQHDFIVTNENPMGKKDLLVTAKRASSFSQLHEKVHPYFRDYLNRHALYDLFLVDLRGRVVYSVFKETDFSTSLHQGPWSETGLANAFETCLKLKTGEVHIEDFSPYLPSYNAPASFAGTPIFRDGKKIGVLLIQLPLDKISGIVNDREGLGELGETLLLGSDLKLRADTFRNKSTHNVAASFARDSKVSVESAAVQKAHAGETGFHNNVSYDGLKTLAYYFPFKIRDLNWYVVVELSEDEVFTGLKKLTNQILLVILISIFGIGLIAYFYGASVSSRLKGIAQTLSASSSEVSSASVSSASSATRLSEAATEQAASLQETMASIEEISAMVSQNAESAGRAQETVTANKKSSEEGSKSVDAVVKAIGEIKNTNDEILQQMDESNREFSEIVRIIGEIGEKTNVINEIVFQTKLLSFNASVEAARAGEHGKGFAVVAEEVGNLAQMSGNAAKEITDMLSESIKKVNDIVERTKSRVDRLIEVGKDKIALGQVTAEKCREALDKITKNAQVLTVMTTEIAHASKEQSQGVQEINKAISQLDQVTQQNSGVAQQSSTQAEMLKAESENLVSAIHKLVRFVEGEQDSSSSEALNDERKSAA